MLLGCGVICLVGLCDFHKGYAVESFEGYGEGKSSACRNGLVGVFFVCVGNLGSFISHCRIYVRTKNNGKGKAASSSVERS